MNLDLFFENLTNPALLFFILGIIAVYIKSDLEIPQSSSNFISLYLLFAIGFKGGQELSHETINIEVLSTIFSGVLSSLIIPIYTFFILKKKLNIYDAGAISAAYGSISAVTFITATSFLESKQVNFHGFMVAVMALMEAPAIIIGLLLVSIYDKQNEASIEKSAVIKHSFTNGSVFLIIGSLIIGYLASAKHAEGIKPFTNDIFKGFLSIFLLDMGITSGKKLKSFFSNGWFPFLFAALMPLLNGCLFTSLSSFVTDDVSNRFILGTLAASASYIAVPAAMKISMPRSNPGLFLPMALAITFPINITIGMPIYFYIANAF